MANDRFHVVAEKQDKDATANRGCQHPDAEAVRSCDEQIHCNEREHPECAKTEVHGNEQCSRESGTCLVCCGRTIDEQVAKAGRHKSSNKIAWHEGGANNEASPRSRERLQRSR
jgi:hypothetical protein